MYIMLRDLYEVTPYYNNPLSQYRTRIYNDELTFTELIFNDKAVCTNKNNSNLVEVYDLLS